MALPTALVAWDSTDANTDVPDASQQSVGYGLTAYPTAGVLNYLFKGFRDHCDYLQTGIWADAHTWTDAQTVSKVSANQILTVTNNGTGKAVYAYAAGVGTAVDATSVSGIGVLSHGATYGVDGYATASSGTNYGGRFDAVSGIGCKGSGSVYGVQGTGNVAVHGSGGSVGVYGTGSTYGIQGISGGTAVYGSGVIGAQGEGGSTGYGVIGNVGVLIGGTLAGTGVIGSSSVGYGIEGVSTVNMGIYGRSGPADGVRGHSASSTATSGVSGIYAGTGSGFGVNGQNGCTTNGTNGFGGWFSCSGGGTGTRTGVYGTGVTYGGNFDGATGVRGYGTTGVLGEAPTSGYGVVGSTVSGRGVSGSASGTGVGVYGSSTSGPGGQFLGNASRGAINLAAQTRSGGVEGDICYDAGHFYGYIATTGWVRLD